MLSLTRREIEQAKILHYDEDVTLNEENYASNKDIISIAKVHVKGSAQLVSDLVLLHLEVKAKMVLRSSRSLQPVPYTMNEKEDLTLSFEKDEMLEDSDIVFVEGEEFDLSQEIYSIVLTSVPTRIIGKDEPDHMAGEGWELISEEEYEKRQSAKVDPRWEKLNDFDTEDR